MTFYEAAIEVLRRSGRPLHYKKITEIAIRESLLSHVGKTPGVTMRARLNQEVKREEHSALLRPRPNIFALRDEIAEKLNREAAEREEKERAERERKEQEAREARQRQHEDEDDTSSDDDVDEDSEGGEDEDDEQRSRRRRGRRGGRRRGRRRSRSDREDSSSDDSSSDDSSDAREDNRSRGRRRSRRRSRRSRDDERGNDSKPQKPKAKPQKRERAEPDVSLDEVDQKHLERGPVRLDGIAQAAHKVLEGNNNKPMPLAELADAIFERKLVRFHTHEPAVTVKAAIINDNQLRKRRGHRPLFVRYTGGRWGLSQWGLTEQALVKEQQILSLSEECRQETLKHLGKALLEVKPEALEQVTLTMLEGRGYRNIKVSKRSSNGDVFFSADWRQGLSDVRVCIQLVGDNDTELAREAVTELRGTLHHYAASEGVIIHFGDISQEAIEESREAKLAPMTLIDRKTYVELLVDQGIGVRQYHTPILMVDTSYIDELVN